MTKRHQYPAWYRIVDFLIEKPRSQNDIIEMLWPAENTEPEYAQNALSCTVNKIKSERRIPIVAIYSYGYALCMPETQRTLAACQLCDSCLALFEMIYPQGRFIKVLKALLKSPINVHNPCFQNPVGATPVMYMLKNKLPKGRNFITLPKEVTGLDQTMYQIKGDVHDCECCRWYRNEERIKKLALA